MGIVSRSQGGGGASLVSCFLSRAAPIDIRPLGTHDLAWDGLFDNSWDANPLAAIPAGLGLTFAFDGTSGTVTTTATGTWSFSYWLGKGIDATWAGTLEQPVFQSVWPAGGGNTDPLAVSVMAQLPSGVALTHTVTTRTVATANPYNLDFVSLYITRLA